MTESLAFATVTPDALLASHEADERKAKTHGPTRVTSASLAGRYLADAKGDPRRALALIPTTDDILLARTYLGRLLDSAEKTK